MLTELQIANRKKGIGASEAAIVMGLNSNVSPFQLWQIKTGREQAEDLSEVAIVHWGNVLEEPIAQEYERVSGEKVRRMSQTLFHKEHSFMLCHLDRKIEGKPKHLECKFAMFARDEWGVSGSDVVPLKYIVQVQHQLAVTGYVEADLAVLIGGYDFRVYPFKRDEALIARIIQDVSEFWKLVESDTPPPLRDRIDAELMYPFGRGDMVRTDDTTMRAVEDYRRQREIESAAKKAKKESANVITLFMKDNTVLRTESEVLVTWKQSGKSRRLMVKGGDDE